jgi:hypothetical protein
MGAEIDVGGLWQPSQLYKRAIIRTRPTEARQDVPFRRKAAKSERPRRTLPRSLRERPTEDAAGGHIRQPVSGSFRSRWEISPVQLLLCIDGVLEARRL